MLTAFSLAELCAGKSTTCRARAAKVDTQSGTAGVSGGGGKTCGSGGSEGGSRKCSMGVVGTSICGRRGAAISGVEAAFRALESMS